MRWKGVLFFVLAVCISVPAARFRWMDSAHSIGLIKATGGEARHPAFLQSGKDRYNLIATATVIPPYSGDAKVVLEGEPKLDYEIFASGPVIDLKFRRLPKFSDNTLRGLQPNDRIALWVLMKPPLVDPVCGMAHEETFLEYRHQGVNYTFCSEGCLRVFRQEPGKYLKGAMSAMEHTLVLYDTQTGASVLKVPVIFRGREETGHAEKHDH